LKSPDRSAQISTFCAADFDEFLTLAIFNQLLGPHFAENSLEIS
jgi:hypothetical protein